MPLASTRRYLELPSSCWQLASLTSEPGTLPRSAPPRPPNADVLETGPEGVLLPLGTVVAGFGVGVGAGVGEGGGEGVGVGSGSGSGSGVGSVTAALAGAAALSEPAALVAVTTTLIVCPTSSAPSV